LLLLLLILLLFVAEIVLPRPGTQLTRTVRRPFHKWQANREQRALVSTDHGCEVTRRVTTMRRVNCSCSGGRRRQRSLRRTLPAGGERSWWVLNGGGGEQTRRLTTRRPGPTANRVVCGARHYEHCFLFGCVRPPNTDQRQLIKYNI